MPATTAVTAHLATRSTKGRAANRISQVDKCAAGVINEGVKGGRGGGINVIKGKKEIKGKVFLAICHLLFISSPSPYWLSPMGMG